MHKKFFNTKLSEGNVEGTELQTKNSDSYNNTQRTNTTIFCILKVTTRLHPHKDVRPNAECTCTHISRFVWHCIYVYKK